MPNTPSRPWLDDHPIEPPPEIVDAAEAYRHALEVIAQETDSPHVREYCESILSSVAEMLAGGGAADARWIAENPERCDKCGARFETRQLLNVHRSSHEARPFA